MHPSTKFVINIKKLERKKMIRENNSYTLFKLILKNKKEKKEIFELEFLKFFLLKIKYN